MASAGDNYKTQAQGKEALRRLSAPSDTRRAGSVTRHRSPSDNCGAITSRQVANALPERLAFAHLGTILAEIAEATDQTKSELSSRGGALTPADEQAAGHLEDSGKGGDG